MSSKQKKSNVTKLPAQTSSKTGDTEGSKRIHLRDITVESPLDGDAVGGALRKRRLKTGEDLKTVSDKLRIGRPYLEALEESRYDELPGRTYAIGFVRTYAAYLGLNVAEIVDAYKLEIAPEEQTPGSGENLSFPELREETRLPKGSLLVLALLLGAGVYGAWLLSVSADRMVTERVPPVPERLGEVSGVSVAGTVAPSPSQVGQPIPGLPGDSASAAIDTGEAPAANAPVRALPYSVTEGAVDTLADTEELDLSQDGAVETEATGAPVASVEVAALSPATPLAVDEPSVTITDDLALAVGGARIYGLENEGARVIVRAAKRAWLRIEAGDGSVLLNQTLEEGEMYRAPLGSGAILVARDAGAFELFIDGQALGAAGPSGLVLTGKSLNPDDLQRR